ncbi:MAG TPA: polymer-forming cytoskeletal protein [Verrucomicrobiae bacterium]|nr:polymer-forming cytoskeletal protein [Verrucomicrobiae bacterium]
MFARSAILAAAILLAPLAVIPQDLAPEVLLLSRIKRHLREELAHVPNYTCLETISRFHRDPKSPPSPTGLTSLGTVQLEIVYTNGREWYGSPGARNLSVDNPVAFIGGGMIGTGAFAITMHNIVEGGIFTYRGTELLDGLEAVKYDFRIASLFKPLQISVRGGLGATGEEGSIWVDPQSLDLLRVDSRAVEIPPYLAVEAATESVRYARTRIGGEDALLAQAADSHMLDDDGVENYNRTEFTHCHAYAASSAITFGSTAPENTAAPPAAPSLGQAVPPLLEVTILLTTPVSDKDSMGSIIQGKITGDVIHKGKVVLPDGSVVQGRIRALDRHPDLGAYTVGLEFTDVEVRGESLPFYADLLRLDKDPRIERELLQQRPSRDLTAQPELPGVASFLVKGENFTLPAGFRTVWRTRALLRGQ